MNPKSIVVTDSEFTGQSWRAISSRLAGYVNAVKGAQELGHARLDLLVKKLRPGT